MKILMVCLGNICRSPLAEGILAAKLTKHKIQGIVDSAAVSSYHTGESPDERAIRVAKENNIDISSQRARRISKSDFEKFDLILSMDHSVHEEVMNVAPGGTDTDKARLFLEFSGYSGNPNVPDPYFGEYEGFRDVFQLLDEQCENILQKLMNEE
jgi:protein-tyrosine phosphatase